MSSFEKEILNILVRKQRHSHIIDKRSTTLILTDPIPLHHFHPSPPTTHPVQLHHRKTILHNPWLSSYSLLIFPVLLPAHHAVTRRKHHLRCCRNHPSFRNIPFPRHSVLQLYSISQQPCLGKVCMNLQSPRGVVHGAITDAVAMTQHTSIKGIKVFKPHPNPPQSSHMLTTAP